MKRIISGFLFAVMLATLLTTAALAATKQNLCEVFDLKIGSTIYSLIEGKSMTEMESVYEAFPISMPFISLVESRIHSSESSFAQYATRYEDTEIFSYEIPFALYEEKAKSIANYSGNLKEKLAEYLDNSSNENGTQYNSDSDSVSFTIGGRGGSPDYFNTVIGYSDDGNNNYTVYMQQMKLNWIDPEEDEETLIEIYPDYDKSKDLYRDKNGDYYLRERNAFCKVKITYSNDEIYYKSIEKLNSVSDISMITPDTVITIKTAIEKVGDGCTLNAAEGVFPEGTELFVNKLSEGTGFELASSSLKGIAEKFIVYELTAINNNSSVQPIGEVEAAFTVPEEYDIDNMGFYYISPDGDLESFDFLYNRENHSFVSNLPHFSIYVIAQLITEQETTPSANDNESPQTGDTSDMFLWSFLLPVSGVVIASLVVVCKRKKVK